MLKSKSFLAVDFGAGSLKLAEFEVNEAGGLRLKHYGIKALGLEGSQENSREATIQKALLESLAEKGIKAKDANVCAPGFHVFSKFVKLPPVDAGKVTQIIQYEAQQNVPFPLEEVVWDYQILGSAAGGELEVLLVAIKADIVEGLFRVTEAAGLQQNLADVSPAALCNAFRYNYGDLEDCTMLLDIGAKTSNLLFFEKGKVFSRSINLGANSITQDFANESKLKFEQAEQIKIKEGFVSLGGAYEEPENQNQAAISKIARQFMTRLHIQVNQTMQFYRGQQGGSAPQRLFLSGGASIMPYTAQFFAEKLNVPVEYFNPFRTVQIDEGIALEELQRVAHSLGEVVGLGLRNLAHCPVELNLMPESTLRWQTFNQKKPYFIATLMTMAAVVAMMGWIFGKLASVRTDQLEETKKEVAPLAARSQQFKTVHGELKKNLAQVDQVGTWMNDRYYWADVLAEMRRVMISAEEKTKGTLRTDTGIWIERLDAPAPEEGVGGLGPGGVPQVGMTPDEAAMMRRRRPDEAPPSGYPPAPTPNAEQPPPAATPAGAPGAPGAAAAGEVSTCMVVFRAVSLTTVSATANTDIAFAVLNELKASPMFDGEKTAFSGVLGNEEQPGTFTFPITIKLKKPLKL